MYKKGFLLALKDSLQGQRWFIDRASYSRLIAHHQRLSLPLPHNKIFRFYPGYSFQLYSYQDNYYLAIDYTLVIKNVLFLNQLLSHLSQDELLNLRAIVRWNGWQFCKIISISGERVKVYLYDYKEEIDTLTNKVIPDLPIKKITRVLHVLNINFDLDKAIKQHSLTAKQGEARTRSEKVRQTAREVADQIFPIRVNGTKFYLDSQPVSLSRIASTQRNVFPFKVLPEPQVQFGQYQQTTNIRDGITKFGVFDSNNREIEIVPICHIALRDQMTELIHRLQHGQVRYRGSERTFRTKFTYHTIISFQSTMEALKECQRLVNEHASWVGNRNLNRIFLVHTPENEYSIDDEQSPYYQIKRFLFENGISAQMVDSSTIQIPKWKDLNLALNMTAKCGVTPWVLSRGLSDADFFIGLSFTQNHKQGLQRLMAHANVFDPFGQWQFHSGRTNVFDYEQRIEQFFNLAKQTLTRLSKRLNDTPSIHFHYSKKFSADERNAILDAARSVRPNGKYTFVWINKGHNVRLYDNHPQTDGSLERGSYVITSPHQVYLSTTGYNPFQKSLGTPLPLQLNVWEYYRNKPSSTKPDLRTIALQILSLTKLNWASSGSLSAEPITTKYAGSIAYLTAAFLRQGSPLKLHKVLEETPWFI